MTIRYALFENKMLHATGNEYLAMVTASGTADFEAVAARMADMGTTVTKADILAVFSDLTKATESLLADGFNVNFDGLCNFKCSVKGVFDGPTDSFDSSRHRLQVNASIGQRLSKAVVNNAKITKSDTIIPAPTPAEFVDTASGTVNDLLTVGNIGTVNGWRLKFDAAAADEGVFLIADDDSEIKVTSVAVNKPAQLTFLVPDLAGFGPQFRLQVRSRMVNPDGSLRIGRLETALVRA